MKQLIFFLTLILGWGALTATGTAIHVGRTVVDDVRVCRYWTGTGMRLVPFAELPPLMLDAEAYRDLAAQGGDMAAHAPPRCPAWRDAADESAIQ